MRLLICAFLVVVTFATQAQAVNTEIEKEYMRYNELIKARDFEKILDYTHPDLFKEFPREQVKASLEQIFNNPQIKIELSDPKLSDFKPVKQIDGKYYVKFKSAQTTKMRFDFIEAQTGAEKENSINAVKQNLAIQFGEGAVSHDAQTGFFIVNAVSKMAAFSEDKKVWRFVDIGNAQLRPVLDKFIPAEIFVD